MAAAALLLIASGVIHIHLWSTGYRHIPTIGPLFLMQGIVAVALGVLVAATRRLFATTLGALFAISTIGGFLLSVGIGLFGFRDTWSAPYAGMAFTVEIAATVLLSAASIGCVLRSSARSVR
jgi:hypothetical protein